MTFAKFYPLSPADGAKSNIQIHMHAFDQKASSYHENSHVQQESADWLAEWLPPVGSAAGNCLEFGAGTGNLTRHLFDRFELVEATDIAPRMIEEGRLRFPNSRWRLRDAWAAPSSESNKWDYILSSSMLQWAKDPAVTLRHWAHQLREGGTLLCGIYVSPSLPELGALLPASHQFPWRQTADWLQTLRIAGLRVTRADTVTRHYIYPNSHALMRRLHDSGVAISSSPLSSPVIKKLLRNYDLQFACDTGVVATWSTLRIEALR